MLCESPIWILAAESAASGPAGKFILLLTIFVLAVFVGFEIITKIPPTLHTPLMSGSNAISGITLVGAILSAGVGLFSGTRYLVVTSSDTFDQSLIEQVQTAAGSADVFPVLTTSTSFPAQNVFDVTVQGYPDASPHLDELEIVSGRNLGPAGAEQVLLGETVADALGKKAGDSLEMLGKSYQVTGIFAGTDIFESGSIVMELAELQTITEQPGKVSAFLIDTESADPVNSEALQEQLADAGSWQVRPAAGPFDTVTRLQIGETLIRVIAVVAVILATMNVVGGFMVTHRMLGMFRRKD